MNLRYSGAGRTFSYKTGHADIMREKRSGNSGYRDGFIEGSPFGGNNFELTEEEQKKRQKWIKQNKKRRG